jgi:acylphosphatase
MKKETVIFVIAGKVQGVWFRRHTKETALELGIKGTVQNLADGSVEVKAQGDKNSMEKFNVWLQKGPTLARVDSVVSTKSVEEEFLSFEILR